MLEAMEVVETTDWNTLYELHGEDIDGIVDCVSEYIRFCMDTTFPLLPKQQTLKALFNRRKRTFKAGYWAELKQVQRELAHNQESKDAYRKKLEEKLGGNKAKNIRSGMRDITGFQRKGGGARGENTEGTRVEPSLSTGSTPAPPPPPPLTLHPCSPFILPQLPQPNMSLSFKHFTSPL